MTINSKYVVAELRRDANFVWHAAVVAVFVGFCSLAIGATLIDLIALRH